MKVRILELIAAAIFVAAWILAALAIPTLPAQVPTRFGLDGAPEQMGSAATLWVLPAIATGVYVLMSATQLMPRRWMNYRGVTITDENREAVYALGRAMLPAIKVGVLLTTVAVEWSTIDAAERGTMGPFFAATFLTPLALTIGTAIYYTLKMRAV
jgi:uncharacterized membrane protein